MKRPSRPNRTSWFIVLAVEVVLACLLMGGGVALLTGNFGSPANLAALPPAGEPTADALLPTAEAAPTDALTSLDPGLDAAAPTATPEMTLKLPQTVAAQMDQIQIQVSEIRGLASPVRIPRFLQSRDQFRQVVEQANLEDYNPQNWDDERRVLSLWGLIPPELDLASLYNSAYPDAFAGYYSLEQKSMYIIADGAFGGPERRTYAHEFTHALQDLHYSIEGTYNYSMAGCQGQSDRCTAIQALIEGDATIVEEIWYMRNSSIQDRDDYNSLTTPTFEEAPLFFGMDAVFPYVQGAAFLLETVPLSNYSLISDVYLSPPSSTEQILHPELYQVDEPVAIELPLVQGMLGDGWRVLTEDTIGEWYLYLMLSAGHDEAFRLDGETAYEAAAGWDGDRVVVLGQDSPEREVMLMVTTWDTEKDAKEFQAAFEKYGIARWGIAPVKEVNQLTWFTDEGFVRIVRDGSWLYALVAPDEGTLDTLRILGGMTH